MVQSGQKGADEMASNILLFTLFSFAVILVYYCAPLSYRKSVLIVANIVFYLSISTVGGGGIDLFS